MKDSHIKILFLEDLAADVELTCYALRQAGLQLEVFVVDDEAGFRAGLESMCPDIVLADYALPRYDGMAALALRQQLAPELPFVFVTGTLGEERAVEMLRVGATDFVRKGNLSRLPFVVLRALAESDSAREQARIQCQLDHERQLFGAVLETTGALIVVLDAAGSIVRLNPAAESALGLALADVVGQEYWCLFAAENERDHIPPFFAVPYQPQASGRARWRTTLHSGRTVIWSASRLPRQLGGIESTVLAGIDITEQEKAERQADYLRHYDDVTGLPNRALLLHRLGQPQLNAKVALIIIGIARLHDIHDSLGGEAVDLLLREVARRLLGWQQAGDWLARAGDDSFAMILGLSEQAELTGVVRRLLELLRQPYRLGVRDFVLAAYLGGVELAADADPSDSLHAAEAALHHAASAKAAGFHLYQPMLSNAARERLALESELYEAVKGAGQLELHYQPQADLRSGRIVGLEALVRWRHARLGLIPPAQFIPLAESCGLIIELGELVLNMACRQAAAWQKEGLPPVTMAVNLAAAQWAQPNLIATIRNALAASGLPSHWLELELTESDSMQDPGATIATMQQLQRMGVHMSIDDFGTGYCNLNYLKRFPVGKLKIDRSFVSDITTVPDDLAISRTVIAMAHQLRLKVVAEGVETQGQLALLSEADCDLIQGYYFSRPLPAEACAKLLADPPILQIDNRRHYQNTILILDDESNVLSALRRLLRSTDYHVLTTTSPWEAFELLATHEAGVIVSDQRMPELNGSEFLNRAKDMYPNSVRIILSGYTDLQTVTEAINRGAIYKFLTKPWDEKGLLAALSDAFNKYHRSRLA